MFQPEHDMIASLQVKISRMLTRLRTIMICTSAITSNFVRNSFASGAINVRSVAVITEPSAGSIAPVLPCSVLFVQSMLVNQQLILDCGNLRVDHAVTVQPGAATECHMLDVVRQYFRIG